MSFCGNNICFKLFWRDLIFLLWWDGTLYFAFLWFFTTCSLASKRMAGYCRLFHDDDSLDNVVDTDSQKERVGPFSGHISRLWGETWLLVQWCVIWGWHKTLQWAQHQNPVVPARLVVCLTESKIINSLVFCHYIM